MIVINFFKDKFESLFFLTKYKFYIALFIKNVSLFIIFTKYFIYIIRRLTPNLPLKTLSI